MNICCKFFSSVFLCVLLVSPFQTQAQTVTNESAYRALLFELIKTLQIQIAVLQTELENKQTSISRTEINQSSYGEAVATGVTYNIQRAADVGLISNNEHREYFARVFELFPNEYDSKITRLEVFNPENANFDAYVETIPPENEKWLYAVNEEIIEDETSKANTELIIHELAHIVSYEEILGVSEPVNTSCEDYFDMHGCPAENSYLGQFVNTFWSSSDLARAKRFLETSDPFEAAASYYSFHENDYVTDYAASGPEEDFSDSFVFFILEDPIQQGTLARQKVEFFENYSKFIELREYIFLQK